MCGGGGRIHHRDVGRGREGHSERTPVRAEERLPGAADAAVAILNVTASAVGTVTGNARMAVDGSLSVVARNLATLDASADAQQAVGGSAVASVRLDQTTDAVIDSGEGISAASVSVNATQKSTVTVIALASPADRGDVGSEAEVLPASEASALAVVLAWTTARIIGATVTTAGAQSIVAHGDTAITAMGDASLSGGAQGSSGPSTGVALIEADLTTRAIVEDATLNAGGGVTVDARNDTIVSATAKGGSAVTVVRVEIVTEAIADKGPTVQSAAIESIAARIASTLDLTGALAAISGGPSVAATVVNTAQTPPVGDDDRQEAPDSDSKGIPAVAVVSAGGSAAAPGFKGTQKPLAKATPRRAETTLARIRIIREHVIESAFSGISPIADPTRGPPLGEVTTSTKPTNDVFPPAAAANTAISASVSIPLANVLLRASRGSAPLVALSTIASGSSTVIRLWDDAAANARTRAPSRARGPRGPRVPLRPRRIPTTAAQRPLVLEISAGDGTPDPPAQARSAISGADFRGPESFLVHHRSAQWRTRFESAVREGDRSTQPLGAAAGGLMALGVPSVHPPRYTRGGDVSLRSGGRGGCCEQLPRGRGASPRHGEHRREEGECRPDREPGEGGADAGCRGERRDHAVVGGSRRHERRDPRQRAGNGRDDAGGDGEHADQARRASAPRR